MWTSYLELADPLHQVVKASSLEDFVHRYGSNELPGLCLGDFRYTSRDMNLEVYDHLLKQWGYVCAAHIDTDDIYCCKTGKLTFAYWPTLPKRWPEQKIWLSSRIPGLIKFPFMLSRKGRVTAEDGEEIKGRLKQEILAVAQLKEKRKMAKAVREAREVIRREAPKEDLSSEGGSSNDRQSRLLHLGRRLTMSEEEWDDLLYDLIDNDLTNDQKRYQREKLATHMAKLEDELHSLNRRVASLEERQA